MSELKLEAKTRDLKKSLNESRKNKMIPAVLYGKNFKPLHIELVYNNFVKVYKEAGESTVLSLDIDGKKENTLIKDLQFDPIKDTVIHIDFLRVDMNQKITANVELKFIGLSKAVKDLEGILVKNINEIEVECLPANLPKEIIVDISSLNTFEDVIKIKDLPLPQDVHTALDQEEVVATVTPPRSEEELESLKEDVEEDVEKVEGVKKEEPEAESTETEGAATPEKKEAKKE
ncbi:MAG: 50S ribosomal protein L25 [Patescibacteria group bacterium]|nr:50S ribosomal protein L25 [Patescibacteria group bacterium]